MFEFTHNPDLIALWRKVDQNLGLQPPERPPIQNLVLEATGHKGIAICGALKALDENGKLDGVKRVAGGVPAMLLAIGCSPDEMQDILKNDLDMSKLLDRRVKFDPTRLFKMVGVKVGISDFAMFFKHKGMFKGDLFLKAVRKVISIKLTKSILDAIGEQEHETIEHIRQECKLKNKSEVQTQEAIQKYLEERFKLILEKLYIADLGKISFQQLDKLKKWYPSIGIKDLYIPTTRLSDASGKVFSVESDPNMPICDAARITMSYPAGCEPVKFQDDYFASGEIAYRYPMSIFDSSKYTDFELNEANVNPSTLGIIVDSQDNIDARWHLKEAKKTKHTTFKKFVISLINSLRTRGDMLKDKYDINCIQINDQSVYSIESKLSPKKKKALYHEGQKAVQDYMDLYRGIDVQYSDQQPYLNYEEKYYSKSTPQLIKLLENDLYPLFKELQIFNGIDYRARIIEIEQNLAEFEPAEVQYQDQLYEQFNLLAVEMESIDDRRKKIELELTEIDKDVRVLWQKVDDTTKKEDLKSIFAMQSNLSKHKQKLYTELQQLNGMVNDGKLRFQDLNKQINKEIFPIIEAQKFCQNIVNNGLDLKLRQTLLSLDDQISLILKVIHNKKSDYPDPRVQDNLDKFIFELRGHGLESLSARNKLTMPATQALDAAIHSVDLIKEFMEFGATLTEAKELETQFSLIQKMFDKQEARIRLLSAFLVKQLLKMNLISDSADEIYMLKTFYRETLIERMKKHPHMSVIELECELRREIINLWRYSKTESTQKDLQSIRKPKTIDESIKIKNYYTHYLSELQEKLSKGSWEDHLAFTPQLISQHNLAHMSTVEGETYGKIRLDYIVKPLNFDEESKLPIKAHLLRPSDLALQNESVLVKEMVLIFSDPLAGKYDNLYSAAQAAAKRKNQFELIKANLIKQVVWSIQQMREVGIHPPDAKIALTVYGEGLGAMDAQYMLAEVIDQLHNKTPLRDITKFDLLLKDPIRVDNQAAQSLKNDIADLKKKKLDIQIGGYNLIHRKLNRRKPQNYLGQANILSQLEASEGEIIVDVRNKKDRSYQYKVLSNKKNNVKQYLNRKSHLFRTPGFQIMHLVFNKLGKGIAFTFSEAFPNIARFLYKMVTFVPSRVLKNLTNPIKRLKRVFNRKAKYTLPVLHWESVIIKNQLALSNTKLENLAQRNYKHNLHEFVEKGEASARLAYGQRPPITNLVFEGGGVKGLCYAGPLDVMTEKGMMKDVKRLAGSSAGAITAALIAFGYTAGEFKDLMLNQIDFTTFMDEPYSLAGLDNLFEAGDVEIGVGSLLSLFKNKGLYKGDAFKALITHLTRIKLEQNLKHMLCNNLTADELDLLKRPAHLSTEDRQARIDAFLSKKMQKLMDRYKITDLGLITFAQMQALNKDFPELNIKELYLTGTNLTDASLHEFSAETEPDMPVVDAVRISMSFPGGFAPVKFKGKLYADGGIANNYPIQIFDKPQFLTYGVNDAGVNPCTLGFLVDSEDEIKARWGVSTEGTKELKIGAFIGSLLQGISNRAEVLRDKYNINSIQITDNIAEQGYVGAQTLAFKMPRRQKERLIQNGRDAMEFYVTHYQGEKVQYHLQQSYENLMQKYYSKPVLELQTILKEEVKPLLRQFKQIEKELLKQKEELEQNLALLSDELTGQDQLVRQLEKEQEIDHQEKLLVSSQNQKQDEIKKLDNQILKVESMLKRVMKTDPEAHRAIDEINAKLYALRMRRADAVMSHDHKKRQLNKLKAERAKLQKSMPRNRDKVAQSIQKKLDFEAQLQLLDHALEIRDSLRNEERIIIDALRSKGARKAQPMQIEKVRATQQAAAERMRARAKSK